MGVAVLDDVRCKACGEKHTLYYPDADVLIGDREYDYTCPTTQYTVRLVVRYEHRVAVNRPKDGVLIRPVTA